MNGFWTAISAIATVVGTIIGVLTFMNMNKTPPPPEPEIQSGPSVVNDAAANASAPIRPIIDVMDPFNRPSPGDDGAEAGLDWASVVFDPAGPAPPAQALSEMEIAKCEALAANLEVDVAITHQAELESTVLRSALARRALFVGRCAGHPNADSQVTESVATIVSLAPTGLMQRPPNVPQSQDASNCVQALQPHMAPNNTAGTVLRNECRFDVSIAYCNYMPEAGTAAGVFDCGMWSRTALDILQRGEQVPAPLGRAVRYLACPKPTVPFVTFDEGQGALVGTCGR